ncbi:hypothetical protein RQN9TF_18215 [Rhodococcus qingshengii]|uniref:hypothetical protein n=1 Tax=Rhodococcus TaxID=1827 RepID=UPI000F6238E2|nr:MULTISPECIES: hypothetical protein [Rhodococcus]AZI62805.1 hypothetical protein EHW12_17750 [Rhodococcus sp. NJ-530]BDQ21152.1 hypothetical protein RQN9TF_18215 [Rhodococcus qingshengii]
MTISTPSDHKNGLALTKVGGVDAGREVVASGSWYTISYAVRRNGDSPAKAVMQYLREGGWQHGYDKGMEADEQVNAYARLIRTMECYADLGEGDHETSMNALCDGLFEFKARSARISFYDTPGDGTFEPKSRHQYPDDADCLDSPTWFIPDLDSEIRLCSGWPKDSRTTKPSDINFARSVRTEDLEYD